jgi:hypothetical protein
VKLDRLQKQRLRVQISRIRYALNQGWSYEKITEVTGFSREVIEGVENYLDERRQSRQFKK